MKNNIAKYRNNLGISQRQLAKAVNVSDAAVAMWEKSKRSPTLKKSKEIADFFNVSVDDIFFNQELTK